MGADPDASDSGDGNDFNWDDYDLDDDESDPDFDDVDDSDFLSEIKDIAPTTPAQDEQPIDNTSKPAGVVGSIGERAKALAAKLGIVMPKDGAATHVFDFSGRRMIDVDTSNLKKKRYGHLPGQDAVDAKDEIVALGMEVVQQSYDEAIAELKLSGDIPENISSAAELAEYGLAQTKVREEAIAAVPSQNDLDSDFDIFLKNLMESMDAEHPEFIAKAREMLQLGPEDTGRVIDLTSYGPGIDDDVKMRRRKTRALATEMLKIVQESKRLEIEIPHGAKNAVSELTSLGGGSIWGWEYADKMDINAAAAIIYLHRKGADEQKFVDLKNRAADMLSKYDQAVNMPSHTKLMQKVNNILRDKAMKLMRENGFEFDSVPLTEFVGVLKASDGSPIRNTTKFGREVEEAFSYIPKTMLLSMIADLKNKGKYLTIRDSKARGHYDDSKRLIRGDDADTFLHEMWHFFQHHNKNISTLENAWLHGRLADSFGNIPLIRPAPGDDGQYWITGAGINNYYTTKQYAYSGQFFDGKNVFTEVSTTLMQDLFTTPGSYSTAKYDAKGRFRAIVKNGRGYDHLVDPFQDPTTGIWYTDSSKATRINPVAFAGRTLESGVDLDFKAFGIGLMLTLFDWNN